MKHLTDEQLGARRDGAMPGPDADAADRHLAECPACRERLAGIASLDAALAGALEHDPGEAYFASFSDRVGARIAREPSPAAAPARRTLAAWWNSPRGLAWAGGALGVIAVAALVTTLAQQHGPQELASRVAPPAEVGGARRADAAKDLATSPPASGGKEAPSAEAVAPKARAGFAPAAPEPAGRALQSAAPPEPAADRLSARERDAAPEPKRAAPAERKQEEPPAAPAATRAPLAPQNVMEVRTLPNGEQVGVGRALRQAPAPAPPIRTLGGLLKPPASPMGDQPVASKSLAGGAPAAAPSAPGDAGANGATPQAGIAEAISPNALSDERASADGGRLCGTVRDARGRPAAGAMVSVAETGASASAAADGSWCVAFPERGGTLSVLAIGYRPFRAQLPAGAARPAFTVTLDGVDALAGSAASPGFASPEGGGRRGEYAYMPGGGASLARRAAIGASALAEKLPSAALWARAAELWETAGSVESGAARLDAQFHVAEARVNAWLLDRTEPRRAAAQQAASRFIDSAPAGTRRDVALGWYRTIAR